MRVRSIWPLLASIQKGRVEIPEAGFEQDLWIPRRLGILQSFLLSYGDGLSLDASDPSNNKHELAFDFEGTLNEMSSGVSLRYAGDDFLEKKSANSAIWIHCMRMLHRFQYAWMGREM